MFSTEKARRWQVQVSGSTKYQPLLPKAQTMVGLSVKVVPLPSGDPSVAAHWPCGSLLYASRYMPPPPLHYSFRSPPLSRQTEDYFLSRYPHFLSSQSAIPIAVNKQIMKVSSFAVNFHDVILCSFKFISENKSLS